MYDTYSTNTYIIGIFDKEIRTDWMETIVGENFLSWR